MCIIYCCSSNWNFSFLSIASVIQLLLCINKSHMWFLDDAHETCCTIRYHTVTVPSGILLACIIMISSFDTRQTERRPINKFLKCLSNNQFLLKGLLNGYPKRVRFISNFHKMQFSCILYAKSFTDFAPQCFAVGMLSVSILL